VRYDASRPVPWARLLRLFLVYAVIANLTFFILFREDFGWGAVIGTAIGGLLYLAISAVLVKLGWNPPHLRARANAREASEASRAASTTVAPPAGAGASKARPAPTSRTNAGNPKAKRR
jgi:hypothetical protein